MRVFIYFLLQKDSNYFHCISLLKYEVQKHFFHSNSIQCEFLIAYPLSLATGLWVKSVTLRPLIVPFHYKSLAVAFNSRKWPDGCLLAPTTSPRFRVVSNPLRDIQSWSKDAFTSWECFSCVYSTFVELRNPFSRDTLSFTAFKFFNMRCYMLLYIFWQAYLTMVCVKGTLFVRDCRVVSKQWKYFPLSEQT